MPKTAILQAGKSYTFSDYFELPYEPDEILAELGYALKRQGLDLPRSPVSFEGLPQLKASIERRLPYVSLTSETARREVLISPVLLSLIDCTESQLRIEYAIRVSEQLKGTLDYYLYNQEHLLVIEAKNADLARGFTQLAVELIALDCWLESTTPILYGAVSTGDIWQFGCLDRANSEITQDLNLYRVPADLEEIFSIAVAILSGER